MLIEFGIYEGSGTELTRGGHLAATAFLCVVKGRSKTT